MEGHLMTPPLAPPTLTTSGEDSCSTEVTTMAIDGVTLLICLSGLVGNGAVLWLLGFRIRRNPLTIYILNLAVADFTFLLFMVTSSLLYMMENASCSPVALLRYLRWLFLLSLFSYNTGLYLLTAISSQRCMSILWPGIRHTQRLSIMVCVLLWAFSITIITAVTSLCLLSNQEHCRVALISMYTLNFLLFAPLMVISSTTLFIKVQCDSQQHQPRRFYSVIFLTILLFLLFALPLSIWNFLQQIIFTPMPTQVVFLLACINSGSKPFIYFSVGTCQRGCSSVSLQAAFQRVFEEPEDTKSCNNDTTMAALAPDC
ncbi:mas-related G-protein coupled receptor member H-like [Phaenicophaeus curvirostris]|uniref:mas-related G-protein coupled receptor member H-like n=1 Tax=Phaenicophaeus curvirostris TaxID=33595 RepID=UPI0037F0DAF5